MSGGLFGCMADLLYFTSMETPEDNKLHRLGNVIYYIGLTLSLGFAFGAASDMYIYQDWLPVVNSIRLLAFSLTGLGIIVTLEVIRRISIYISSGKSFLDKKTPLFFLSLLVAFAVSGLASVAMSKTIEPGLEAKWLTEQKTKDEILLVELEQQFRTQRETARECQTKMQQDEVIKSKVSCEAEYRKAKMGYDSCMMYGWHTMCLQYNDYEVIDCSDEALAKPIESYYPSCAFDMLMTKKRIDELKNKIENY
jgi:hypothetical protein